jgi:hypothetical protein
MLRFVLPAGAALATVMPAVADANPPTASHARAYEHAYHEVAHLLGRRAPGRNIVKDGFSPHHPATDAETVSSLAVLERMIAPASSSTPAHASATTPGSASSYSSGLPSCASESGTNYSTGGANTNATSGATGRYQITPSTAANYGCNLATAGGQDACAQTIYEHQGASAWVGCGG